LIQIGKSRISRNGQVVLVATARQLLGVRPGDHICYHYDPATNKIIVVRCDENG